MFSLESPHRGNSNEYTQYAIFIKKKITKLSQICSYGIFSKELKNEFKTAMVNSPSVFEPLKVYCIVLAKSPIFSSPGQSPGRAIVLPLALALALTSTLAAAAAAAAALAKSLTLKFFM